VTYNKLLKTLIKTGQMFDLTVKELAELTGYGITTVGQWHSRKNRKTKITVVQFVDWANALGYEVTLVRREDDPITNVRTRK
tara:strand:- start:481 stop:726 length:246 start_codon:yes stop_codon:yes gene_type:complete